MAKFKYTKEMLIEDMVKELGTGTVEGEVKKPNVLEILKSKAGLNRKGNERTE